MEDVKIGNVHNEMENWLEFRVQIILKIKEVKAFFDRGGLERFLKSNRTWGGESDAIEPLNEEVAREIFFNENWICVVFGTFLTQFWEVYGIICLQTTPHIVNISKSLAKLKILQVSASIVRKPSTRNVFQGFLNTKLDITNSKFNTNL